MKKLKKLSLIVVVLGCLAFGSIFQSAVAYADGSVVQTKQLCVTYWNPTKTYNGYTLFAPLSGKDVWLIDMQGRIVHHWEMPSMPGTYAKLLPNGNLIYACKTNPEERKKAGAPMLSGFGGLIREVDWDNNLIWEYEDHFMHHDFCRMKNGNTMVLKYVQVPPELMVRIKGGVPGTEDDGKMWTAQFDEVTPEGKVVWSWKSYEHLDPEKDAICPLDWRKEWTHANTCVVLDNEDILTSFRNLDMICIIDKKTGNIKWQWGQGPEELAHQHDPHFLPNGNLLIFDNGINRPIEEVSFSRVIELNPESKEIEWQYEALPKNDFYSPACSSAQRLPNGNTLICETMNGRIFEITPEGEIAWQYICPFFNPLPTWGNVNWVFKAHRYGPDDPRLKGRELNPKKHEEWNRLYGPTAFKQNF